MSDRYVPAAGRALFTPLYDAVNAVALRQGRWRPRLVERALSGATPTRILVSVVAPARWRSRTRTPVRPRL